MAGDGGYLTTHVLDTAQGVPAAGLRIELFRLNGDARITLGEFTTNVDGRTDAPVLSAEDFTLGTYELVFHAGAHIAKSGATLPEGVFLDAVPIRFVISDPAAHYHVPLLLSPYGYATYRGS
ncbi:MAG: hydroxyisourate hydrolase [Rhodospirillaceae bacterium]|mgnify:FL=1|nr:hydroxyisourate hydrolase [Rhodospirillaceae bacterium]|tara:strand:+ start:1877 stop:2242 length:366 start_codon:yes stop_codon:yes gene_type:complete